MNFLIQKKKFSFWLKIFTIFIFIFFLFSSYKNKTPRKIEIFFHNKKISAYVADDFLSQKKGLAIFESLSEKETMLFVFKKENYHPFWMKDMQFSIDIIWLNNNKEVVFIKKNAKPEDYPSLYIPNKKSLFVLEFSQGFVDKNNIVIGSKFHW